MPVVKCMCSCRNSKTRHVHNSEQTDSIEHTFIEMALNIDWSQWKPVNVHKTNKKIKKNALIDQPNNLRTSMVPASIGNQSVVH